PRLAGFLRPSLRPRGALLPWLFLGPGLLWLIIFFAVPLYQQLVVSLMSGNPEQGYTLTWEVSHVPTVISDYNEQLLRSIGYAAAATFLCFVIAFPLAYFIAFK